MSLIQIINSPAAAPCEMPKSDRMSIRWASLSDEAPPTHMQQPERDDQEPVAYHSRDHLSAREALDSHEQCQCDVAIAGAQRHDLAGVTGRAAQRPAQQQRNHAHE